MTETYTPPPNGFSIEEIRMRQLRRLTSWAEDDRGALLVHVDRLTRERNEAAAEVELLREALAFYADERNYKTRSVYMCGHFDGQAVMVDQGRQARIALKAKP